MVVGKHIKPLHSKRGYIYILLILLSLASLHLLGHLLSGSIPHFIQYIFKLQIRMVSQGTTSMGGQSSLGYILRFFVLRFGIYPMLLLAFFFDHVKDSAKWFRFITPQFFIVTFTTIFIIASICGKIHYDNPPHDIFETLFCLAISSFGIKYRIYSLILWASLFTLSFHFFKKKLPTHQALWISALIFLSCEEVWEYAPFLRLGELPTKISSVTLYIFRASPTFLLLFYVQKEIDQIKRSFFFISLSVSLFLSGIFRPQFSIFALGDGIWLRLSWFTTYLLLSYYMASLNFPKTPQDAAALGAEPLLKHYSSDHQDPLADAAIVH